MNAVVKEIYVLPPKNLQSSEFAHQLHTVTAPEGVEPGALLNPDFWSNVAVKMKPRDKIEAWAEDGTWYAEYLVINATRSWAKVFLINGPHYPDTVRSPTLTASKTEVEMAASEYEVKWRGPHKKFSVVRIKDGAVLQEDIVEKSDAEKWLKNHVLTELNKTGG